MPGSAQVAAGRARPFATTALAAPHPVVRIAQPVATAHEAAERASIAEAASQTAADSTEAETAVVGRQRSEHGRAASGARCDRRGSSPAGCRGRTVPHHRQTGSYHRKPLQRLPALRWWRDRPLRAPFSWGRETAAAPALAVARASFATQGQMLLDWPLTRRGFTRQAPSLENPML